LGVDPDDIKVVDRYKDARFALGDMYEHVRTIEINLHELIRKCLASEFGKGENGWWRKGVPVLIRQKCVGRREEDDEPLADPFGYADLVDLKEIVIRQWAIIREQLPGETAANRKAVESDLNRLNQIRKLVMHPVRGGVPSEDDFDFVRSLKQKLGLVDKVS
jgi:hypothetical protein